jgi:exopolysaccharide biosynthesis polyprenyl glycosylphosphotransferase
VALKSDALAPWLKARDRGTDAAFVASRHVVSPTFLPPVVDLMALMLGMGIGSGTSWAARVYAVAAFVGLLVAGSARRRITPKLSDDLGRLLTGLAVPAIGVFWLAANDPALPSLVRRVPVAVLAVLIGRALSYAIVRASRSHGVLLEPTLIVGAGHLGVQIAQMLQAHAEFGMVPVGFLDGFDGTGLPLPVLGDLAALDSVLREFEIKRVVVAFGSHREPEMVDVLRACEHARVEVHVLPRFFELGVAASGHDVDDVWGIPLVRVRRTALRTRAWRAKRVFDLVVASIALVVALPILAVAAIAIRVSSGGPVLFRQKRVGQRGRVFELLKFRTLNVNDDSDRTWSVERDERITKVGKVLRATSIDELPQLLNVIRGDMALVGPRPERPHFVHEFNARVTHYDDRHRVPVGITGWAQVHGLRGDTSIEERARFDNRYIEHWSLWQDVVILWRTAGAIFRQARAP